MAYRLGRRGIARAGVAGILASAMLGGLAPGLMAPAAAQLFWKSPDFRGAPVQGDEPTIVIPLPGATQAEKDANVVWTLRAGLNVAALQCQFAGSLMTVANYNGLIAHHSKELNTDYKALEGYFKRNAAKGTKTTAIQSAFDQYTTRTYNSFSTLRAQLGFCQTAGSIGANALMQPKGTLLVVARNRLREFRNSLVPIGDSVALLPAANIDPPAVPGYPPECFDRKGELKKRCLRD